MNKDKNLNDVILTLASLCRNNDPSRQQENKDTVQLNTWRSAIRGQNQVTCSADLRSYLDDNMPGWSRGQTSTVTKNAVTTAQILKTFVRRESLVEGEKHSNRCNGTFNNVCSEVERSGVVPFNKQSKELNTVHSAITDGQLSHNKECPAEQAEVILSPSVQDKTKVESSCLRASRQQKDYTLYQDLVKARDIVQRCYERAAEGKRFLPRLRTTQPSSPDMILDQIYAEELHSWKMALLTHGEEAGSTIGGIRWELKSYLDKELGDWLSITDVTSDEFSQSESFSVSESGSSIDVQASECEREMDTFDQVSSKQSSQDSLCDLPDGTTSQSHTSSNPSPEECTGEQQGTNIAHHHGEKCRFGVRTEGPNDITNGGAQFAKLPLPHNIRAAFSKTSFAINSKGMYTS